MSAEQIELATRLLANGYPPVPILRHDAPAFVERNGKAVKNSPGKRPHGGLWSRKDTDVYGATPATVEGWKRLRDLGHHPGIGIACGNVVAADVDIYEPALAQDVEALVIQRLGATRLRRVGQAPKALLLYRAAGEPIVKAETPEFGKGDLKAQLEVMGLGQQVVGYGIHPSGSPYTWSEGTPDKIALDELPAVTREQVAGLVAAAEALIRAAGYRTKAEIEAPAASAEAPGSSLSGIPGAPDANPFRLVNDRALQALDRWVPALFGQGARRDNRGVWRVPSAALGRDREEDLSISPAGIVDFGEHDMGDPKRGKRTAIDLVMAHGGAGDAKAAARWLADQLGVELQLRQGKGKRTEPDLEGECESWNEQLHRNDRGEARDIIHNVTLILRTDDRFTGRLRWNQMLEAVEAQGLPWRGGGWREWTDADDIYLAEWCQKRHAYVKRPTCAAAVQIVARDLAHHPVRERLNALAWDGTHRIGTWLSDYLGVALDAYANEVGMRWLISAVARVFQPGCKADHCLILEGPQGVGKSTAAATIAMEDNWFSDELADLGTKDAAQDLRGKWIVELGELSALNRGAVERIKAFMSRRIDHYRPSYGTRSQDFPRQCVFVGSTNADAYLGDETGGRRFWPVKVGAIDLGGLKRDREQLWAEAVAAFRAGATWWLDKATEQTAREQQADRRVVDPWEHAVIAWATAQPGGVSVQEALENAVHMPLDRRDQMAANRVGRIFKASGWDRRQDRVNGTRVWRYHRPKEVREPTDDEVDAERRATAFRRAGASPVSPVSAGPTGDGKTSNCAAVTSVTSVTSRGQAHAGAPSPGPGTDAAGVGGWGVRNFALRKTSGDTGDSRPPWRALDHWQQRLGAAGLCRDKKVSVVLDWGRAAGGRVDTTGEQVRLSLPSDLEDGYPLRELRRVARDLGLMDKVVFMPIDLNGDPVRRGLAS